MMAINELKDTDAPSSSYSFYCAKQNILQVWPKET